MDSRVKTYALTAGSAAALAAAGSAAADIITSSGPSIIPSGAPYTNLFSIGSLDVVAEAKQSGNWSVSGSATALLGGTGGTFAAQTVASGNTIDAGLKSGTPKSVAVNAIRFSLSSSKSSFYQGGLSLGANKLLAIQLGADSQTYYGWINFSLSKFEGEYTFTINSWAYNDVADQGIIAGQNTAAGSAVVPGLGGLAALAIGAAGVRTRRQRIA